MPDPAPPDPVSPGPISPGPARPDPASPDPAAPDPDERRRDAYRYFSPVTTRWIDNDVYGHVNNAVYYQFFDTVANAYLIERGGLDIARSETIAFVVASRCRYHVPIAHPAAIEAGLRVNRLGRSSVEYGIGIFVAGEAATAAEGTFTHVFVDRAGGRSVPIPAATRAALERVRRAGVARGGSSGDDGA